MQTRIGRVVVDAIVQLQVLLLQHVLPGPHRHHQHLTAIIIIIIIQLITAILLQIMIIYQQGSVQDGLIRRLKPLQHQHLRQ